MEHIQSIFYLLYNIQNKTLDISYLLVKGYACCLYFLFYILCCNAQNFDWLILWCYLDSLSYFRYLYNIEIGTDLNLFHRTASLSGVKSITILAEISKMYMPIGVYFVLNIM